MAISNNVLLKNLSGHIGKQLVVRQYGNVSVVCKYPDMSRRKLSPKQIEMTLMTEAAVNTAKAILASEELRQAAQLRLNVTRNRLYPALIREYFQLNRSAPKE